MNMTSSCLVDSELGLRTTETTALLISTTLYISTHYSGSLCWLTHSSGS